jgi:adenine phosphoribosyltransferase
MRVLQISNATLGAGGLLALAALGAGVGFVKWLQRQKTRSGTCTPTVNKVVKRPYKLHAASGENLFLELKRRGVDVEDSSLLVVEPPPGMGDATCAAYAALHYYRFSLLPESMDTALLLPAHPEVERKGHPYINTLAVMRVPALTRRLVEAMAARIAPLAPTVIIAFETRAMAFGAVLAYRCNCAFVPARKEVDTVGVDVVKEVVDGTESYRDTCRLAIDGEPFVIGDRVVIVDDVISSGATIRALRKLVQKCGVDVVGDVSLVNFTEPSAGVVNLERHSHFNSQIDFA